MRSHKVLLPKGKVPQVEGEEEEPEDLSLSEERIREDMQGRNIKFDLTREDRYWYTHPEEFWEKFQSTDEIKVPEKFEDWLVGQERVKQEARLQLEEWVRKLKDMMELRKKGVALTDILRERPGPYLMLVGEPGCLDGDTRIPLEDGSFIRLKELGTHHLQEIDISLQTLDGIDRAKVFHIYRDQPTLRVRLRSGREIIGTYNHPMLAEEGWCRLEELKPGDLIRCQPEIRCKITEDVPTGWVRKVVRAGVATYLYYETIKIPDRFNPQLAYLMGYVLGDGHIEEHRVNIYVSELESDLIGPLVAALQDNFGVSPRAFIKAPGFKRRVPMHHLRVDSGLLASFFNSHGEVPEFVFKSPNRTVAAFLRGLFDADGHITSLKDKRDGSYNTVVGLKQGNLQCLRDVQLLLLRFGINSRVYQSNLLKIHDNWSLLRFSQEIGFGVRHKSEALQQSLTRVRRIVKYDRSRDEVLFIEPAGNRDVYDVEVPETHCFLASGLISHNTGKSLLVKALASDLERLYEKHGIKLHDTLLMKNQFNKFQPHTKIVPSGMGRRILDVAVKEQIVRGKRRGRILNALLISMVIFGAILIGSGLIQVAQAISRFGLVEGWFGAAPIILQPWMGIGAVFTIFPLFLILGGRAFGINLGAASARELMDTPHLLIDNGSGRRLWVNSTVSNSGKLFGDLEWCNTAETLVADPEGHLFRIDNSAYATVLGNAENSVILRHAFASDIIALRTRSGRVLRGNPGHPVMTRDGWRQLQEVRAGMQVSVATELPMPQGNAKLNWELSLSAYHGRNMTGRQVLIPREATPDLAALAGWLVAEGWATYYKDHPRSLHVEIPTHEAPLAEAMARVSERTFGISPVLSRVRRLSGFTSSQEMIRFLIPSVDGAPWLAADVADKRVPDWVLASGEEVSSSFLRWLLEGDGCVSIVDATHYGIVLSQKREALLRDVQVLLLRYGIQARIYRRRGREEWNLWIRRASNLRTFHRRIGFVSPAKRSKLDRLVAMLPVKEEPPATWDKVVEVEHQPPETVHGFMLDGDATYWSNGILSHNSPYGDHPSLAVPTHKRVVAGDIHNAHMKILYIDELKNLDERSAIELLTVMEDGAAPIKGHQGIGGTHTASQNIETGPVEATFFLICAANLDMIQDPNSVINLVPALKDRFNYGNIVMMDTEMDATPENEIKVAQVVADEDYRFHFPPMEKEGVRVIIDFMRRKASNNKKMRITFRPVIKILKKSAQLCWAEGGTVIGEHHVRTAIEEYTKPIEQQMLEQQVERQRPYKLITHEGVRVGVVNGLVVYQDSISRESAGDVASVAVWMTPVDDSRKADFVVTGVNENTNTWIGDSKKAVRTAIYRMYGIDIQKAYYTHVHFMQSRGVDGPSAGITMTLGICSWLGDPDLPQKERKPIPIRQDCAVTGAIEIIGEDSADPGSVRVSPVGGIGDKARGAESWGIRYVVVPMENFEHSTNPSELKTLKAKVMGARTVRDYLLILRGDKIAA